MWRALDLILECATRAQGLPRLKRFYKETYETELGQVLSGALMLKKAGFMATSSRQSLSDEGLHCDVVFRTLLQSSSAESSGVSYDTLWVGQHASTIAANLHRAIEHSSRSTVVAIIVALFKSDMAAEVDSEYVKHYAYTIQEHVRGKFGLAPRSQPATLELVDTKDGAVVEPLSFAGVLIRIQGARTHESCGTRIITDAVEQLNVVLSGPSDVQSIVTLLRQLHAMPREQLTAVEELFSRRFARELFTSANSCAAWSATRALFSTMGLGSSPATHQWPHAQPKQMAAHVSGLLERVNGNFGSENMDRLSGLLLQLTPKQLAQVCDQYSNLRGHTLQRDLADNSVLVSRGLLALLAYAQHSSRHSATPHPQ